MELLTTILSHNSQLEVIKLLLDNEKEEKLNVALVEFKKKAPAIEKLSEGMNLVGQGFDYAKLEEIQAEIDPVMLEQGLLYSFTQRTRSNVVQVTCTITHTSGGSKSVTMSSAQHADDKMTAEQQTATTTSYLKRYTLTNALGLIIKGQDSDGCDKAVVKPLGFESQHKSPAEAHRGLKEAVEKTERKENMIPVVSYKAPEPTPVLEDAELDALTEAIAMEHAPETPVKPVGIYQLTKSQSIAEISSIPLLSMHSTVMNITSLEGVTVVTVECDEESAIYMRDEFDYKLEEIPLNVYYSS
ncbi:essential recombination function protein [Vibrio phage 1.166.O._10N.261.51.C7]|nr:essential recombination function protein [Vibrio phage 1.166.O._10N.261.51.C7]AUR94049.1 essential recombination function protein [Vibrio phage 1.190.O._10N.286.51.F12]